MRRLLCLSLLSLFPSIANADPENNIRNIRLPEGFKIEIYAASVDGARSMTRSPGGVLFVGTRREGRVYAIKNKKVFTLARRLNMPNGVAFKDGDLYVAEINRILRYKDMESRLANPPEPEIVNDSYPTDRSHGWKFIAFGPDGDLYVPVGAPCNICEPKDRIYASITRIKPDGSSREIFASGIRNTVGFDWHPETKELWFTDNGRDWMGDNRPPDELNRAPKKGMHFGYPYCHGGDLNDPKFGDKYGCDQFVPPAQKLGPHVAALGMRFYTGTMFPEKYRGGVFIAEHGSWNRSKPIGYRVMFVKVEENKAVSYEVFAEGWLKDGDVLGRPVDVLALPDGSLLVSDDYAGAIYRISYRN